MHIYAAEDCWQTTVALSLVTWRKWSKERRENKNKQEHLRDTSENNEFNCSRHYLTHNIICNVPTYYSGQTKSYEARG